MGNSSSNIKRIYSFNSNQWQQISIKSFTKLKDPYFGSNFKVIMNKINNCIELQKYDLVFYSFSDFSQYQQIMKWRNIYSYFVQTKFIQPFNNNNFCSSSYSSFIVTERIPIRLVQIHDMTLDQGLYVMQSLIQGFYILYKQFGYFQIESDMIGFTKQGEVRMWINSNFSIFTIDRNNRNQNNNFNTFIMPFLQNVQKLIDFQGCLQYSKYLKKIKSYEIKQNFIQYIKLIKRIIPRYMLSIKLLCNSKYKTKNNKNSFKQIQSNRTFINQKNYGLSNQHMYQLEPFKLRQSIIYQQIKQNKQQQKLLINSKISYHNVRRSFKKPKVNFQYSNRRSFMQQTINVSSYFQDNVKIDNKIQNLKYIRHSMPLINKYNNIQIYSDKYTLNIDPQIFYDLINHQINK